MGHNYDADVIVVGAGPAGSRTAGLLSENGHSVILLEEHSEVGLPVHCSGFITPRTLDIAGIKSDIVLNSVKGALVYTNNSQKPLILGGDVDRAFVVDRELLDKSIAGASRDSGTFLKLGTKVVSVERNESGVEVLAIHDKSPVKYTSRCLVGADGVRSIVAQHMKRDSGEMIWCIGAEAKLVGHPNDMVRIYVNESLAPGWFGWSIPTGKHSVRLGIGTTMNASGLKPRTLLNDLFSKFPEHFKGIEVNSFGGGFIPLYSASTTYANRSLLVGDAALQVKPTSGGGIYTSLKAASHAARTLSENLFQDSLDKDSLSIYQKNWIEDIGIEMERGLDIRETYLSLEDAKLNRLIDILRLPLFRSKINSYGDIDYPSKMFGILLGLAPILKGVLGLPDLLPVSWRNVVDSNKWDRMHRDAPS
ncbi:MAG: geranylgeranyl reductase family protein [Dehalococcoidia bacterium]